jgi:hypothetical protein
MRFWAQAVLACCVLAAAPAVAQQSLLGNTGTSGTDAAPQPLGPQPLGPPVAVPPAPPMAPAAPMAPAPVVISPSPPPGLVQTTVPPPNDDSGAAPADNSQPAAAQPDAAAPATAPAPVPSTAESTPPPLTNDWVPQKSAALGILDKVDGSTAAVTIPVGGQSTIGDLLVNVLACDSRPTGEIPDDAIFVSIQPVVQSDGGPIFRGWMLRSIPGAAVVGDASETFRVVGCD